MQKIHLSPAFKDANFVQFIIQLQQVDLGSNLSSSRLTFEKMLKAYLEDEKGASEGDNLIYLATLREVYDYLNLEAMSVEELNEKLQITYSDSTTIGYKIETPDKSLFYHLSDTFFLPLTCEQVKKPIAREKRSNVIGAVKTFSQMQTQKSYIDIQPLMDRLFDLPINNEEKSKLMNFNIEVIKRTGCTDINFSKINKQNDFGYVYFSLYNKKTITSPQEKKKIQREDGKFWTARGEEVVPIPFLFDTSAIKQKVPLKEQEKNIRMLSRSGFEICTQLVDDKGKINEAYVHNALECYLKDASDSSGTHAHKKPTILRQIQNFVQPLRRAVILG